MHKNVAYGGIGTALVVILISLASYLPTGRAALLFAASALVYIVAVFCNIKTSAIMYAASSILGVLISRGASLTIVLMYVVVFGNYPIFKRALMSRGKAVNIVVKSLLYLAYFAILFSIFKYFIPTDLKYSTIILLIFGVAGFAFYDVLLNYIKNYALKFLKSKL